MDNYITRANIDHFLSVIEDSHLDPGTRAVAVRLLRRQLDKLSVRPDQLEFAESKVTDGQVHLNKAKRMRDGLADPTARAEADGFVATLTKVQELLKACCERLRAENSRGDIEIGVVASALGGNPKAAHSRLWRDGCALPQRLPRFPAA